VKAGNEGSRFLLAFQTLKHAVCDDPHLLSSRWRDDPKLQKLCDELSSMIHVFVRTEDAARLAFTPHVPAAAIAARSDYEVRWQGIVSDVVNREWEDLLAEFLEAPDTLNEQPEQRDLLADEIQMHKRSAKSLAASLEAVLDYAEEKRADDEDGNFEWMEEGFEAWQTLVSQCGLNVAGALWRRRMVPHILIPSHVSKRYGSGNASLYRRMLQAADAFVFGVPLASLAMQRAVLEQVLKDHWDAERSHIRDANLPNLSWDSRADRLKRRANEAMHESTDHLKGDELNRLIIESFGLLKLLIENAPISSNRVP